MRELTISEINEVSGGELGGTLAYVGGVTAGVGAVSAATAGAVFSSQIGGAYGGVALATLMGQAGAFGAGIAVAGLAGYGLGTYFGLGRVGSRAGIAAHFIFRHAS